MKHFLRIIAVMLCCGSVAWAEGPAAPAGLGDKFLGFPMPEGAGSKMKIVEKVFPPEFLKLGLGSPVADLQAAFPKPGDGGGKSDGISYYQGQNFLRDEGGKQVFAYYGNWCETSCWRGANGVNAIERIQVIGRFEVDPSRPLLPGTRQDAKAMVSAFFAGLGTPRILSRLEKPQGKGMQYFDILRWDKPEGIVLLYFFGFPMNHKMSFEIRCYGHRIAEKEIKDFVSNDWATEPSPIGKDFAARFETFCDELNVAGKKAP